MGRSVREDWRQLAATTNAASVFDEEAVAELPEAAQRWLVHAIPAGTPMWRAAELEMRGEIRLGRWWPFTARQVLAPPDGYIWAATARIFGFPVTGYDRMSSGSAEMRWRMLGVIPVMTAGGVDIRRSAAGRLAGECALVPTTFHQATWAATDHDDTVRATWQLGEDREAADLQVGVDGQLLGVMVQRWGNPNGAPYGRYPFGVSVEKEATYSGITIASEFHAGWWWGTERQADGEFFRATITGASFS